jgi:phage replication-related protein YjqB (UPF0714/DUF867 family)
MIPDRYSSFEQLFESETEGVDYQIICAPRDSEIVILAPHGGGIEPGTSEIATTIAADDYALYKFEGLGRRPHSDLHVTSHRYDEPQAIDIVKERRIVVAVHGRGDKGDAETVWIGGCDAITGGLIKRELSLSGFSAQIETTELGATNSKNICNRGLTSAGVQLEIPRSLRDRMLREPALLEAFSQAVRRALTTA